MHCQVIPIPIFSDNYVWCIHNQQHCVVVDPGDAEPVITFIKHQNLTLAGVLITHHHWDHTDGLPELLNAYPNVPVYGPNTPKAPLVSHTLKEDDVVDIDALNLTFSVVDVPGHTLDHIAYVSELGLFCGDTLFSAGCGRLFEGTPEQMHASLNKLMALPDNTLVYCTHEYTLANLEFAQLVEPDNAQLRTYTEWAQSQRAKDIPTLPTTIEQQKKINPFVRVTEPSVISAAEERLSQKITKADQVFAVVREWKDRA
ncbi:hydroxyacylglutathione hydrolase [Aestuariibacter sp. AA17]|uniref:Hydroxyacylglutathione hydrolase n=1 Tax=Fluctibacter corallii TaxID=2984329 RepID=A0ABT3A8W9_9ALTE|nr:hydroxyacylglutathione hydrolase [Aestuariibacter sp. AA17]MCV2885130.1 hydroxyacylglutathione hydrolase [Aestuariibacter sp. AA17]